MTASRMATATKPGTEQESTVHTSVTTAPPKSVKRRPKPPPDDVTETPANTTDTFQAPAALDPAETRNLLVILHGKRVADELLREAITQYKTQGHNLSVRVTFDRGDVEAFISEAIRLNEQGITKYETIVAGGGDGTLNELVCALMMHQDAIARQGLAVALIPLGTANDFACVSGISVDPMAALRVALDPSLIRPIDVASVNGKFFVNIAVAGSVASVSPDELSSKWKRLLGPVAIGFHVLKRMFMPGMLLPHKQAKITFCSQPGASPQDSITSNSTKTLTADLLMLASGNSRQMGRTINVCPDAKLDDGLLDFTLLTGKNLTGRAAQLLSNLACGPDDQVTDRGIAQLKASWLEVEASDTDDAIPVNRDGEPEDASSRLVFEVYHKVLPFHLPDSRVLQDDNLTRTSSTASSIPSIKGDVYASGDSLDETDVSHHDHGPSHGAAADDGSTKQQQAATAAPAGDSMAAERNEKGKKGEKSKKRKHTKLRKSTLRKMIVAVQPEGREVRNRAQLIATSKQLAKWGAMMLVGGMLGWVARARQESEQPNHKRGRRQRFRLSVLS